MAPRAGDIHHFGVLQVGRGGLGVRVLHAGAQDVQFALALVFADQVGDQRFHRAAPHRRDGQRGRRQQQHAGAFFLLFVWFCKRHSRASFAGFSNAARF